MILADEDRESDGRRHLWPRPYNMEEVYSRRPDLRALELGVKITEQQSKVALSSMLPNVALIGSYSFSNPNMFNGFSKKFDGAFSVGAMVTIPLWHWGGNYNKYRAAKSETTIMKLRLEDAREMIDLQVSQAAFKTQEAVRTHDMTEVNMRKADENLRTAELAFREGVATVDNVMAAQTAWLQASQRTHRRRNRPASVRSISVKGAGHSQLFR